MPLYPHVAGSSVLHCRRQPSRDSPTVDSSVISQTSLVHLQSKLICQHQQYASRKSDYKQVKSSYIGYSGNATNHVTCVMIGQITNQCNLNGTK